MDYTKKESYEFLEEYDAINYHTTIKEYNSEIEIDNENYYDYNYIEDEVEF